MAARKAFLGPAPSHPELEKLLETARTIKMTDDDLREQRVSFAYGNAPDGSRITKDSVRSASDKIRIARS